MRYLTFLFILLSFAAAAALGQSTSRPAVPSITGVDASGISGPGACFSLSGPIFARWAHPGAAAVKQGLIPSITPLMDLHIRDTSITHGKDGNFYLTGSTGDDVWDHNDGIELWRSPDLKTWDYLGLVWSFEKDATWQKEFRTHLNRPIRSIWGPKLNVIHGNYYLTYSMPPGDRGILRSKTGKPEGPYVNVIANDGRLPGEIDASLFQDDDGKVYVVYGGGWIARMNGDMSGPAEDPRKPELVNPDKDPKHHAITCVMRRDCNDIGREGAFLFKRNGKYYLTAADTYDGRYSSMAAISDSIYGPYQMRHEAVPCGGGSTYFKDAVGNWWCTFFGNDTQAPWREMPGIVPVHFAPDGKIVVVKDKRDGLSLPPAGPVRQETQAESR